MSILSKIFGGGAKDIIDSADSLIDNVSTSDEEKMKLKKGITDLVYKSTMSMAELHATLIKTEMTGNWLQRSWRPLIMLSFGFVIFYQYFIALMFSLPTVQIPGEMWDLLQLAFGLYVAGRTGEKIASNVTKNIDMPFLRKRDRSK